VNFSATRSQGNVWLAWEDIPAHGWRMTDVLNGDAFERDGDDVAAHGLYVDLGAWQFHWLAVTNDTSPRNNG